MKGKTSTGFEFDIEDERLDDMELVDIMAEIDENPLLMPKLCKMLLGEEQKKKTVRPSSKRRWQSTD